MPAPAMTWDGFYLGGLVSFESGDTLATPGFPNSLAPVTAFGGFAGYNMQVNALVYGGEVAYTSGDIAGEVFTSSLYTDRIDLKARVGYSLGRAMVYGVVGYSWAEFDDSGAFLAPSSGLNYGVGVDYMVTDRVFVGAEYLMRDLSGNDGAIEYTGNLDSAAIRVGLKF